MKYCLLLCSMFMSFGLFAQNSSEGENPEIYANAVTKSAVSTSAKAITNTGYATYYAKKFEGRKTSSGVRYRARKMTAAHMRLPFGTIVTVTNLANGKSIDVEVNDRGPHSRKYMIDLSEGAAKELGFYRKGQSKVEISYHLDAD